MPFTSNALIPLIQTSGFNLWHYRSPDLRIEITAPGYFNAAATSLRAGDVMILQAADAMAMLPVRSNALTGPGVTLDGAVTPISLTRSISQVFSITQAASAVVRTIILAPLLAGIVAGTSIPVQAQVHGPVSQVMVSLRDSAGRLVPPAQVLNVDQGYVTTALPTPPVGSGYRIRIEDALDPTLGATSPSFNILPDLRLVLTEDGLKLLQEDGFVFAQH
jgi:hypothetical protein